MAIVVPNLPFTGTQLRQTLTALVDRYPTEEVPLPQSLGGTGATTAAGARENLGVIEPGEIGAELVTPTGGVEDSLADHLAAALIRGVQTPEMHGYVSGGAQTAIMAALAAGPTLLPQTYEIDGLLRLSSGATLFSNAGARLVVNGRSFQGGIVSNIGVGNDVIENVLIDNIEIDLSQYPDGFEFSVVSATTTTITLPAGAPSEDDAYIGYVAEMRDGTIPGQSAIIVDYDGASRTATLASALTQAPLAGETVKIGTNENGLAFAGDASNVTVRRVIVRGPGRTSMVFVPAIAGGKACALDTGTRDVHIQHVHGEELSHSALFVQGRAGKPSTETSVDLVTARDCGALITVMGLDASTDPSPDPSILNVHIGTARGVDVGQMWIRRVKANGDQEKSGIVNLGEARSVRIDRIFTRNSPTYTDSWPAAGQPFAGSGMTGPVGAALWGWGPNIKIGMHEHHGDLDAIVHVGRARAAGDDAGPLGHVFNCTGWNLTYDIHASVGLAIDLDNGPANQVPDSELTGYMRATVDAATAFCDSRADGVTGFVLDIEERDTGKRIIGSLAQIYARGVTFADYPAGLTDLRERDRRTFTLADNAAASFTPLWPSGIFRFTSPASNLSGVGVYRVSASPQCRLLDAAIGNEATTGALTGTTGSDDAFTFSAHTDGKIYVENRRGVSLDIQIVLEAF